MSVFGGPATHLKKSKRHSRTPSFSAYEKEPAEYEPHIRALDLNSINGSNLSDIFEEIAYWKPSSESNTVIFTAFTKDAPRESVIMKVSHAPKSGKIDNSLLAEIQIYKRIVNVLYRRRITPHVTPCLGTFRCNDFMKSLGLYLDADTARIVRERWISLSREYEEDDIYDIDMFSANFIVFHLDATQRTLSLFIKSLKLDDEADHAKLVSVVWQTMYTLHCFNKVKLRHNDLHFGNILVVDTPVKEMSYFIDAGVSFTVPTHGVMVQIYDYDRSNVDAEIKNTLLDSWMCKEYGTCNGENPHFDIFTFVHLLYFEYLKNKNTKIKSDIESIIKHHNKETKKLYYERSIRHFKISHLMCDGEKRVCRGEFPWKGLSLPTPETFIRNLDVFKPFMKNANSVDPRDPNAYFSSVELRDHFIPADHQPSRYDKLFEKQFAMQCVVQAPHKWSVKAELGNTFASLIDWTCGDLVYQMGDNITGTDSRKLFNMLDDMVEFLLGPGSAMDFKSVAMQFMHKFYGIEVLDHHDDVCEAVYEFTSTNNSSFEHLFYCSGSIDQDDRRLLIKQYEDVVRKLAEMYTLDKTFLLCPEDRAKKVVDFFRHPKIVHEYSGTFSNITKLVKRMKDTYPTNGLDQNN